RDVLKRGGHEPRVWLDVTRDLYGCHHVWLLPAVDEIPSLAEQRTKLPPVLSKVRMKTETHVERNHRAGFRRNRFELDRPEIAADPGRRRGRHLPLALPRTGHLVCEAAILSDHVRVSDGQQSLQSTLSQSVNG